MATVVAHAHRQHAFWLRVVEDLALVTAVAVVAWLLFVGAILQPSSWREAMPVLGMSADPRASEPLSIVAASQPMFAAVAAATALEEQGAFGPEVAAAWNRAFVECRKLSMQPIATSQGEPVLLWLMEAERERAGELDAIIAAHSAVPQDVESFTVLRDEALANAERIHRYREIVNFDHWRAICAAGVSPAGLEAREAGWLATRAADEGRLGDAKGAHEASFDAWRRVLDAQPGLLDDALVIEELSEQIGHYRSVLAETGGAFPESFILQDVVARGAVPAG